MNIEMELTLRCVLAAGAATIVTAVVLFEDAVVAPGVVAVAVISTHDDVTFSCVVVTVPASTNSIERVVESRIIRRPSVLLFFE